MTVSDKPIAYVPGRVSGNLDPGASSWLRSEFNRLRDWISGTDDRIDLVEQQVDYAANVIKTRGWRNWILNGEFWSTERGSSWSDISFNAKLADRWLSYSGGSATGIVIAQPFLNADYSGSIDWMPKGYLKFEIPAPTAQYAGIAQIVEDVKISSGKTVTVSTHLRSRSLTADSVRLRIGLNFGSGGSAKIYYEGPQTALPNDSVWRKLEFTVEVPSLVGKTFVAGNGVEAIARFTGGSKAIKIDCTGFQVEFGPKATPFEVRPRGEEEQAMMRYYFRTGQFQTLGLCPTSSSLAFGTALFPEVMRINPTITETGRVLTSSVTGGAVSHIITRKSRRPTLTGGSGGVVGSIASYVATDLEFDAEMSL